MTLEIGTRLGPYEVVALIGAGGMGEVYRAKDIKLRRDVAIKVLRPDLLADPKRRDRFLQEARTAASMNHPNIATIYSVDDAQEFPFIAMELVEGKSLRVLMNDHSLPISEALRLATEIGEGLCHAHRSRVIHRDLKPENVIVDSSGRAKILDFGLAKCLETQEVGRRESELETQALTDQNVIVGTAAYMSPEQVRGEDVDARSDIFSFGITLYEMIAGSLPFQGKTRMDVLAAILTGTAEPLVRHNPKVPLELDQIVGKCLEKNREKRFQHSDELVVGLRNLRAAIVSPGIHPSSETGTHPENVTAQRRKIVVLPFENLGPSEEEYFASGMTEEITSRLAVVRELGVISRTTAMQYTKTGKSIRQIGAELGVDFVLEGTVRWARGIGTGSRVRITPQLIRVSDDTHLWADRYDRVMDDIFQIQSEIAENVTEQLGVMLLAAERRELHDRPTENVDAYQAYLRGLFYERPRGFLEERDRLAVQMFQRAVELDPDFALAHAELATTHSALYHYGFDHSADRLTMATSAVEQAAKLAPQSPRVRLAMGYYHYWCRRDYERAIAELTVAEKGMPGNSEVLTAMGFVRRRQGMFESALSHFKKASELNPMDTHSAIQLGDTYFMLGRYSEAEPCYDQSIRFLPDQVAAYVAKASLHWTSNGDIAKARAVLEAMPETARNSSFGFIHWFWQEIFEQKYREALDRLSRISEDVVNPTTRNLLSAQVYLLLDEGERSCEAFEAARVPIEDESRKDPENYWLHATLGIVYACLGRKEEAILEGKRAMELCPISRDPMDAGVFLKNLALIHIMVGEYGTAVDEIERLLESHSIGVEYLPLFPSEFSLPMIRLDPRWRPVWDHPRFKALK